MEERKTPSPEAEVVSRGKCQNIKIQENVIIFYFRCLLKRSKLQIHGPFSQYMICNISTVLLVHIKLIQNKNL